MAAGPLGWALLAVDILKSKTARRIILWIGIVFLSLGLLAFLLVIALFNTKRHFGPDTSGGVERTEITNKSLPAQAGNDKGQAVVTGLDTIDASINAAQQIVNANPSLPNASEINTKLNQIKTLRRDTETKAYGASQDQAKQLLLYRQILADISLLLDGDAATKRDMLQMMIEDSSSGIALESASICAPSRDIRNLAVTGKLLNSLIKIAELSKSNGKTATLTCLVTGYRDLTDGAYHGYPMCKNQDGTTLALSGREQDIAAHCNGRAADFGGDWEALLALIKDNSTELGLEIIEGAGDHLHIEVQP